MLGILIMGRKAEQPASAETKKEKVSGRKTKQQRNRGDKNLNPNEEELRRFQNLGKSDSAEEPVAESVVSENAEKVETVQPETSTAGKENTVESQKPVSADINSEEPETSSEDGFNFNNVVKEAMNEMDKGAEKRVFRSVGAAAAEESNGEEKTEKETGTDGSDKANNADKKEQPVDIEFKNQALEKIKQIIRSAVKAGFDGDNRLKEKIEFEKFLDEVAQKTIHLEVKKGGAMVHDAYDIFESIARSRQEGKKDYVEKETAAQLRKYASKAMLFFEKGNAG